MTLYVERLTRFAFDIVGSDDSADDVVQQVFVELWERRASLNPAQLKPYLFRAVRNRALDDRKATIVRNRYRTNVEIEAAAGIMAAAIPNPEDHIITDTTIQAALNQLSERRKLAVRLRFEEEMTHAEIAQVLGISSMAAQSLVARGIADLRTILWEG
jgi:RNA polymerase sigma-70 factor (ECF subfamily)